MSGLVRSIDWSQTSVGPIERWPASLRTMVNLALGSEVPIFVLWGPELVVMYNDEYMPLMAEKHPALLGQAGSMVWREAWHIIGPKLEATFAHGERFYFENALIPVMRGGVLTDVYWTYGYSPIRDAAGAVCGVMAIAQDGRVLLDSAVPQGKELTLSGNVLKVRQHSSVLLYSELPE